MSDKRCPFCGTPAISIFDAWKGSSIVSTLKDEIGCDYCNIWMDEKDWNQRAERTAKIEICYGDHPPYPLFKDDAWTAWFVCSECAGAVDPSDKYCKHCGAKLDGAQQHHS